MVPKEEFERVRSLLAEAIDQEFQGLYLVPELELAPGYWVLWPHRSIRVKLSESHFMQWGVPMGGTDKLQVKIHYPYDVRRFSSKGPISKKFAIKVAEAAREISEFTAKHYHDDTLEAQEAYLIGYKEVEDASEQEREDLWLSRGPTWTDGRGHWDRLHRVIHTFLKMPGRTGVLDWIPDDASEPKWDPFLKVFNADTLYDKAMRGALDAIDDWAVDKGFITQEQLVRE